MNKQASKSKKILLILSIIIVILFSIFSLSCFLIYNKTKLDLDKLTSVNNGVKVCSVNDNETNLYNSNRSIVEIETLPKYVIDAFVSIEDKRFFNHAGYDLKRIIKAGLVNLITQSKSQGASTISQQLIKNALLSNEKTFKRKLKEVVLSIKMEKEFSKNDILEMYLNTIYFGSNAYGLENASKTYFNKSASELSLNEACCLAGLIKSPNLYSPQKNYSNAISRRNLVAKTMKNLKKISENDYIQVVNSEIETNKHLSDNSYKQLAILEACQILNLTERDLINNKYTIVTYEDAKLQNNVSQINNEVISNCENTYFTNLDSVSIVLDNNGCVVSYFANSNFDLHNMKRQPASLFKPLAVYLPCLTHNILSPSTNLLDEEINYAGFAPKNADHKFHGNISVRDSLAYSYNIPAVKALDYVGLTKSRHALELFGFVLDNSDYNLSLALGSLKNGVKLLDLANAYSILANMGISKGYTFINKILDKNNKIVYEHQKIETEVFSPDDCFLMNDMLKSTAKYGTAKRLNELSLPVASKTGTASSLIGNTDLYNVAYTSNHTILTWISSIKDSVLPDQMNSSVEPTQINKEILSVLYQNNVPTDFVKPENVNKYPFDINTLKTSNIITTPTHNIERYIAYDYFKDLNSPQILTETNNLNLTVELSQFGAEIKVKSNRDCTLIKQTLNHSMPLKEINCNEDFNYIDRDIFKHNKIKYYLTSNHEVISDVVEIKPKDYLINSINNEILTSKKKWCV